jgi:hypothetical protein
VKLDGKLHRPGVGAEDPGHTQVREQPSHRPVIGKHQPYELTATAISALSRRL